MSKLLSRFEIFFVAAIVLIPMSLYWGVAPTPAWLWVAPVLLVLAGFATAVSLVLSTVNVRFRDVSVAMPLLLQLWMLASPVVYSVDAVPDAWRHWYLLNPMAGIVDSFRRVVLDGLHPDPVVLGGAAAVTTVALVLAYPWFKHVEATVADGM